MHKFIIILILGLTHLLPVLAETGRAPAQKSRLLYELVDPTLQRELDRLMLGNGQWQKLIRQKRLAVCVVNLAGDEARFARVNGNVMMYAASLPKIAILLAAYVSFEDGTLAETPEVRQDLTNMIRYSSNTAATRIIDLVSYDKIASVLRDPGYGLYDTGRGGGLWVGKRYAATGIRRGDPMYNISHGATATQTCRFYYMLARGRLINPARSQQILQDLSEPGLHHKFVGAVERLAPDAKLYRKSGTWRQWHSDSILVVGPQWRNYILAAMVEDGDGEAILRQILPQVETILHD